MTTPKTCASIEIPSPGGEGALPPAATGHIGCYVSVHQSQALVAFEKLNVGDKNDGRK